jgi:hypothetical protein
MIMAVDAPGGWRAWNSRISTKASATEQPAASAVRSPRSVTQAKADDAPRNCPAITFPDRAMSRPGNENSTTAEAAREATRSGMLVDDVCWLR